MAVTSVISLFTEADQSVPLGRSSLPGQACDCCPVPICSPLRGSSAASSLHLTSAQLVMSLSYSEPFNSPQNCIQRPPPPKPQPSRRFTLHQNGLCVTVCHGESVPLCSTTLPAQAPPFPSWPPSLQCSLNCYRTHEALFMDCLL